MVIATLSTRVKCHPTILAPLLAVLLGCGDPAGSSPPRLTDDVPWALRVELSGRRACTGVALSDHWLVTAGHCIEEAIDDQVRVSSEIFGDRTVLYEGGAELILHPDYIDRDMPAHRWNDIGLVGLRPETGRLQLEEHAVICGFGRAFRTVVSGAAPLYSVGYGTLPDLGSGTCSGMLGSKKRYDGLAFRSWIGPPFADPLGVELRAREDALCGGDSGAPFMFDFEGTASAFAIFSGELFNDIVARGPLLGPKIGWLESATGATNRPLTCPELEEGVFQCVEEAR